MASRPILVAGGSGQVASALVAAAAGRHLVRVGRPEVDFDRPDGLHLILDKVQPALVVNAAAYTAVDKAEGEPEAAYRANRDGPARLAGWCAAARVPLIHISTDYVFDGLKGAPYVETDPTSPTGVYGASKLAGEQAVAASGARAVVLRTSWVYAATGKNFVLTMLNAAKKTSQLRVVADQRGCPTAAADLAAAILAIADRLADGWNEAFAGIYHAAGSGETAWHGLAEAVFARAERHGLPRPTVVPIATADWPTPARRPPDSRLDCGKLHGTFGLRLPDWQDSVARTVDAVFSVSGAGGRVAILLATYNGAAYLPAQLNSFVAQQHRDWTLFWHDDGSGDTTGAIMNEFAARLGPDRLVRVHQPNGRLGVLGSFMTLLRTAAPTLREGDAAAFADQDDVWLPEKLARGMAALANEPPGRPALYFTRQILVDERLQRIGLSAPITVRPGFPAALTQNVAPGCTVLLNLAAARLVAGSAPPEGTLHDWWSYILVSAAGGRIIADAQPTILYRQHGGNTIGAASSRLRRAIAAARRGPGPFMRDFARHLESLAGHAALLSPAAAHDLAVLRRALAGGVRQRLAGLRLSGLRRNHWSEGLLFRLWFLIG